MIKITIEGENMTYVDSITPRQAYNIIEMLVKEKARVRGINLPITEDEKMRRDMCSRHQLTAGMEETER